MNFQLCLLLSDRRWFCMVLAGMLISGCAASYSSFPGDRTAQPARDVPEVFVVDASIARAANSAADETCNSPMIDPRDQTRLRLVRSTGGRGDYEVPLGRYGVKAGEFLRLDCKTGRVLGVVKGSSK